MSLILAIEPDRDQADQIATIVRGRLGGELVVADAGAAAVRALRDRVPDLILTPALLPPKDEMVLTGWLRDLGHAAAHVQTLAVPILRSERAAQRETPGIFGRRRGQGEPGRPHGCDPAVFADQMKLYLERAAQERAARDAARPSAEHDTTAHSTMSYDEAPASDPGVWVESQPVRDTEYACEPEPVVEEVRSLEADVIVGESAGAWEPTARAEEPVADVESAEAVYSAQAVEPIAASQPLAEFEDDDRAGAESVRELDPPVAATPVGAHAIDCQPSIVTDAPDVAASSSVAADASVVEAPTSVIEPVVMAPAVIAPAAETMSLATIESLPDLEPMADLDSIPGLDAFSDVDLLAALNSWPQGSSTLDAPAVALDSYLDEQAAAWDPQLPVVATDALLEPAAIAQKEEEWVPLALDEFEAEEPTLAAEPPEHVPAWVPQSSDVEPGFVRAASPSTEWPVEPQVIEQEVMEQQAVEPESSPAPALSTALAPVHVPAVASPVHVVPATGTPASVGVAVAVNVNGTGSQRVAVDVSVSVNSTSPAAANAAPRARKRLDSGPAQDEWGFFDPEQCGFAALMARLDEVGTDEHGRTTKRTGTQVRVVSYG